MRDTFILYTEYAEQIELLSDEQAGVLLKAIFAVNADAELPEMDALTKMAFLNISKQMRRDSEKYEKMVAQRSAAGRKNGKAKTEEPKPEAEKAEEVKADEESENVNVEERDKSFVKRENVPVKRDANLVEHNEDEYEDEDVDEDDKKKREKREKRATRFSPPSRDEVASYCRERGDRVDPDSFMNFYASKGWKVGNQPMKDWKAAVRTWEKRDNYAHDKPKQGPSRMAEYNGFSQRTYDYDEILRMKLHGGDRS